MNNLNDSNKKIKEEIIQIIKFKIHDKKFLKALLVFVKTYYKNKG